MTDYRNALRIDTARAFADWMTRRGASPVVIYHEGLLVADRRQPLLLTKLGGETIYGQDADIDELDRIARLAMDGQRRGAILLAQRRIGPGTYRYLAFKRKRRR